MKGKAIALFSGGLDSILAARIIMEQGIEVFGVNFITEFSASDLKRYTKRVLDIASQINMESKVVDISSEYLTLLKNPSYGFGANINPCIDCKIFMLKKAKEMMSEIGASFIITGEVLGERPMSQRRDALNIIEKKSGLKGYLVRPLSAKLLVPTVPEEQGVLDREKLFSIKGRSRKPQFELAKRFAIEKFFTPAGGCLLTDPTFTKRLEDIINHNELDMDNVRLLKVGRHFRFDDKTKFVLGRDEKDNDLVMELRKNGDIVFEPDDYPGPIGLLRGNTSKEHISLAASFLAGFTKKKYEPQVSVKFWDTPEKKNTVILSPAKRENIEYKKV